GQSQLGPRGAGEAGGRLSRNRNGAAGGGPLRSDRGGNDRYPLAAHGRSRSADRRGQPRDARGPYAPESGRERVRGPEPATEADPGGGRAWRRIERRRGHALGPQPALEAALADGPPAGAGGGAGHGRALLPGHGAGGGERTGRAAGYAARRRRIRAGAGEPTGAAVDWRGVRAGAGGVACGADGNRAVDRGAPDAEREPSGGGADEQPGAGGRAGAAGGRPNEGGGFCRGGGRGEIVG